MKDSEEVQILQDLVSINSVNGNEDAVATYIKQLFGEHGIDARSFPTLPAAATSSPKWGPN